MVLVFLRSHTGWAVNLAASNRLVALLGRTRFSSARSNLALSDQEALVGIATMETESPSNTKAKSKPPIKKRPKKLVPPKRAMNVMQLVTQAVMNDAREKNGGKLNKEQAQQCFRLAAEKYNSLSNADKKNYEAELDRRREIYEIEMQEFLDSLTPEDYMNQNEYVRLRKAQGRSITRKGIPRIDPNAPKRPLNGFMIFCGEIRSNPSKFPELMEAIKASENATTSSTFSAVEGSKVLASYWKSMSDDRKQEYLAEGQRRSDQYKQDRAQYDAQLNPTPQ
ncbi:hypothetical protein Pst134EA_022783 [Puccinia striiformis f. sp. tritici]|uniref:hypothetical protein n=1 Tax=Puccinia striiformis f. sp. tritici TaxID=168172 RepID=UPI000A125B0B|nr:hypothetical protein Pst134EA_022783 [Puccinia striiformis f. sp. tritici]KAH9455312.1 hypothetical protein Pst134EA_022783 [Puccinia striiformis f. sp. tritici]KAI9612268.1 hypothetical protein KEM48_004284 [Puccinia striiformis f. sp. tritici PST-130]